MTDYAVQEMPNITDRDAIRTCVCVQDMRRTLLALFQFLISCLSRVPVTAPIRVLLGIVDRVGGGALSIELLCQKGRARDAAILLLSLHELTLDIEFIARDPDRASVWLDHSEKGKKPWRVQRQIREIFAAKNELNAEQRIYRQYSMAKHGNPVGKQFAFGISPARDSLLLDCSAADNPLIRTHLFGLGCHIHRVGTAASTILSNEGIDAQQYLNALGEQRQTLSKYNEQHLLSMLQELLPSEHREQDESQE